MPATNLEQVSASLVAEPHGEDEERVDEEDEIVARARTFLVKVGEYIDGDVSPKEETAEI